MLRTKLLSSGNFYPQNTVDTALLILSTTRGAKNRLPLRLRNKGARAAPANSSRLLIIVNVQAKGAFMYKTLVLLLVLLVSCAWVQAQAYPQAEPTQSTAKASGHMTVEGCLSGSEGNYTLTADNGTTYQLTGNTAELKDHVGHEVQITGKTSSSSAASSSTSAAQQATLEVKSMKHIAKTCKSAAR